MEAPRWAKSVKSNLRPFDVRDWTVDKKASHELKSFNGGITNYDNWRRRVRDLFTSTSMFYKDVCDFIEGEHAMIPWAKLATLKVASLPNLDWQWIAEQLWTFTARYMSDTLFGRRMTLTGGEEFNGLELWRTMYMENMRGSSEMKLAERNRLINSPGQCLQLRPKYGSDLPEDNLRLMFRNTLPVNVLVDIRKHWNSYT